MTRRGPPYDLPKKAYERYCLECGHHLIVHKGEGKCEGFIATGTPCPCEQYRQASKVA